MKFHTHLHIATTLLKQYDGNIPFAVYLKANFKSNKKHGSNDRKNIARLCYAFLRMGYALDDIPIEEKIIAGLLLTATASDALLEFFNPEWNVFLSNIDNEIAERFHILKSRYPSFDILSVFRFTEYLSGGIERDDFVISHLHQPHLFCRIRPGHETEVVKKLTALMIPFRHLPTAAIELPTGLDIEKHFQVDKEVIIQDFNSQRIGEFLTVCSSAKEVWDCCAGSGGKSILAYDLIPGIELTVSDIRESILVNLDNRFNYAGINQYHSFPVDLSKDSAPSMIVNRQYDLIIADVPCSGSGTWSRIPEQLIYFDEKKINQYASRQKAITGNIIRYLKPGGYLLYVTCSVFAKENEEIIQYLVQHNSLELIRQNVLKGFNIKADTMFAALLKKTND